MIHSWFFGGFQNLIHIVIIVCKIKYLKVHKNNGKVIKVLVLRDNPKSQLNFKRSSNLTNGTI